MILPTQQESRRATASVALDRRTCRHSPAGSRLSPAEDASPTDISERRDEIERTNLFFDRHLKSLFGELEAAFHGVEARDADFDFGDAGRGIVGDPHGAVEFVISAAMIERDFRNRGACAWLGRPLDLGDRVSIIRHGFVGEGCERVLAMSGRSKADAQVPVNFAEQ